MSWEILLRLAMTVAFFAIMVKLQIQVRQMMLEMKAAQRQEAVDRAVAIQEVKRTADALARRTALIVESVKEDAEQATAEIKKAIGENTEMTKLAADTASKAYDVGAQAVEVGNHMNEKLEKLGLDQNSLLKEQKIKDEKDRAQTDSIQETGEDSNEILKIAAVIDLKRKPDPAPG